MAVKYYFQSVVFFKLLIKIKKKKPGQIIHLIMNSVFSSTQVQSWFTPTSCKACVPTQWSAESPPLSSPWPAVSQGQAPQDHGTKWTCPHRRRPLAARLGFGWKFTSQERGSWEISQKTLSFDSAEM